MTAAQEPRIFNHVGILVRDLDEAKTRFAAALSLTFTDTVTAEARFDNDRYRSDRDGCGSGGVPVKFCYSFEGPPYVELIEAESDLYSVAGGEGVHHLGFAEADVEGRVGELAALGVVMQATRRAPDDGDRMYTAFSEPSALCGIRCELTWAGHGPALDRVVEQVRRQRVQVLPLRTRSASASPG